MMNFSKDIFLMRILDVIKKTRIATDFVTYSSCLKMSRSEIIEIQTYKLKRLLWHAQKTVPYYRELMHHSLQSLQNCESGKIVHELKKLPVLTRDILRDRKEDLISNDINKGVLVKGSSSGTTGIPITYFFDKKGLSAGIASGYLLWSLSGWKFGQRSVHIWGNQSSIERWQLPISKAKNFLIKQKNIASTLINDPNDIKTISESIMRFDPVSIDGYASAIYTLAEYFKQNNLRLKKLKRVLVTAENLEEYQKNLIEEIFAPVGDLYGSGEILGVAIRPAGDNKYYVFDPHVIVETVESEIAGMKDLLITDLDNFAMPMIRYKIGDMIDELHEPTLDDKYPLTWFTKIHGRNSDIITLPNGMKFHPVNIFGGTLFRTFKEIKKHKVIWNGAELQFVFEVNQFERQVELCNALQMLLSPYQVEFSIKYTDKILPSKSGKYKYMEIVEN
jgi:phenylacetate-CoA ligase